MREFLYEKGVNPSWHLYFIKAMGQMTFGLFATLIIGLIIKTAGEQFGIAAFLEIGELAMDLYGAAIGAAVALALGAPSFVVLATIVCGTAGAVYGGPAGSFLAAVVAAETGKLVFGSTKVDILVTPIVTIMSGFAVAWLLGPAISFVMESISGAIAWATDQQPLMMSIVVAILMGWALTAPISSAAIGLMLGLEGAVACAAAIGCAGQMVGFAVASFRENRFGGLLALGIGTSMLQMPNILKNPLILIPPTIAGAVSAPIGTIWFGLINNAAGSGMGTSGLVGPIMTFTEMGYSGSLFIQVILCYVIIPAVCAFIVSEWMRRKGWIKWNDMHISFN
ncbi:PTS transporter subunit IIC [Shouchella clausii]|uniref:PTS transporter subunit IIC n=1 Tax=Shouchella clausii TaxID=79880 RepID=UPI001C739309|nr:PTS sugar transporter subunit IIC [Shouchella clausii]MBX0317983.1 PTS sugar transporter subunit IIC [Shouchella clausii]